MIKCGIHISNYQNVKALLLEQEFRYLIDRYIKKRIIGISCANVIKTHLNVIML